MKPPIDGAEAVKAIRQLIREKEERRETPQRIYVNQKTFNLIDDYMASIARYPSSLPTMSMRLFNLPVKVHPDFPEPRVC